MELVATDSLSVIDQEVADRLAKRSKAEKTIAKSKPSASVSTMLQSNTKSEVATDVQVPKPPFWGSRVVEALSLDDVYPYVNTNALFRGQWQFKRGAQSNEDYATQIVNTVEPIFERLKAQCKDQDILQPKVVYGYFPCQSEGADLIIFDSTDHDKEVERFTFPRQDSRKRLCISDFFRSVESGQKDVLALSCVTVGSHASEAAKKLFDADNYAEYLYLHGLGVETAEALAELWHKRIREELGIANDDSPNTRDLFTQKYQGSRYSFGYPACPEMSDQETLFRLLDPSRIGCILTENWQIDPEQSTSAIIVHHPEAKYFNV